MKDMLLNVLLLPKSLYKKITDGKLTLVLGILLVGFIDMMYLLWDNRSTLFLQKAQNLLIINIALAVVFIVLVGLIDVLFFSLPLFDLFKRFKKEKEVHDGQGLAIKLIKVYIAVHFIVTPVNALLYPLLSRVDMKSPQLLITFAFLYSLVLLPVWFSAAISRGINTIYGFNPLFKRFVFVAVFTWNFFLNLALDQIINKWLPRFFV